MKEQSLGPKGPASPKRRETSQVPTRVGTASLYKEVSHAAEEDLAEYEASLSDMQNTDGASGIDSRQFAVNHLRRSLFSKYRGRGPDDQQSDKVLRQNANDCFLAQNRRCQKLDNNWRALGWTQFTVPTQVILGEIQVILSTWLDRVDELIGASNSWLSYGAFGPGSAVGAADCDPWSKLVDSWPDDLTAPSDSAAAEFTAWVYSELRQTVGKPGVAVTCSCSLDSVEKNSYKRRSIGIPTIVSSWGSRAIGILFERVLKELGFSVQTQPNRNAILAMIGSALSTADKPATIDMHASSDSYYMSLLEHSFCYLPNLWAAMLRYRDATIDVEGEIHTLHIFSTMGNGFTFPLQTLWYLAAVYAVYRVSGRNPEAKYRHPTTFLPLREIGVFGDDIILASDLAPLLISFLQEVGFVVNTDKSHYSQDGLFRESCGADWYRGRFVRGVYIKSLTTDAERVISFNQVLLWSLEHRVPMRRTLACLLGGIPPYRRNRVPFYESDDAGIKLPGPSYSVSVLRGTRAFYYDTDYIYRAFRPVKRDRCLFDGKDGPSSIEMSPRIEHHTWRSFFPGLHQVKSPKVSSWKVSITNEAFFTRLCSVGLINDRVVPVRQPKCERLPYREEYVAVPHRLAPPARLKESGKVVSIDTTAPLLSWSRYDSWSALDSVYHVMYGPR